MIVVGSGGEEIGTVERFEIDQTGRLKSLVVRIRSTIGTNKRITAERIRSIHRGTVQVALSMSELNTLDDARDPQREDGWHEHVVMQ